VTAIDIDDHGPVRHVLINRPDRRNSLRPIDLADLIDALEKTAREPSVRCLVLGGRGGWFSAGGDLSEGVASDPTGAELLLGEYQRIVHLLMDMPVAVVTVLEGVVVGAAAAFVLACDICVAAPDSRIMLPAVMRGLVPDGGTAFFLSRTLGPARTKALLLGNGSIPAARAVEWGLIAEIADDPWAAATTWASQLADGPRMTTRLTRRLVNEASFGGLEASLVLERAAMAAAFGTGEPAEGMAAFNERRSPVFS
jgi:2-(1,2-epoxy-1,2-dihydrophenyl)acetyl-CoA isomerase